MPRVKSRGKFKLLKEQTVLRSRVFEIRDQIWRAPDGGRFQRHTIVHPGAIAVLAFTNDGEILMIRQFRAAAKGWLLEIPAGTLEKGEKHLACAKRELIEETGFAAKEWKKLGAVFTAPGFCTEIIHLFVARNLKPAKAEMDDDEHIELVAMKPAAVWKALKNGDIQDAKSMSALLLYLTSLRQASR